MSGRGRSSEPARRSSKAFGEATALKAFGQLPENLGEL
jgi:hypothetical protein